MLTSDSNKAVYFVTVDYNYDDAQEKKTFYSNDINDPGETPPRDGYILTWNKETNDCTITFTAQWSVVYTVTFESNGGSPVEPQTIADGSKVTQPADPTRDGYTFDGWYSDASLTTAWIFDSDTVSKDMTLYAKWKVNEYTVTFASNDGSAVNTQTITYGGKVSEPTAPTREGYTFAGWYSDEALTQLWDFDTVITGNITLYAKWTKIEPEQPSTPSTPSRPTTPSEPEEPSGPSTGDSAGWDDIRDEIAGAEDGDTITIDMNGETEVPADIFEEVAGKDVTIEFDLGDGVTWEVHGTDIPADANFSDLDLGVSMNTSGIPVNVINAITGEVGTVQITLAHDGDFGFALTLSAPLGEENAGYWANLYHYNEDGERMDFETAALIDDDGTVKLRLTHASQYAIVIDNHSHAPVTTLPFTDVSDSDWFYNPVAWAYDNGLMTGTSATTFEPNTSTTRAMIVAILNRLEDGPTADGGTFTDIHDGDWYADAVNWAASEGIVAGFEDGTFRPNDPITREQMAAILYNYAQWKGYDVSARADLSRYSDQPSEWAEDVSRWAVAEGLLTGITEDTLAPQASATRAQVAAIFQRFLSE